MHQHSSVHLPYPTPSINLHTFVINPHASTPTTFTYIFSSFRASPIISNSLTRGRWCTLPVNIGPDFCRSSGPNMPSSPFKVFHPTPFPFSLRFWFIYPFVSRWGLVRSCPPQLFHLLHFLYNVYLFLDVRYAIFFHPLPSPPQIPFFSIVSPFRRLYRNGFRGLQLLRKQAFLVRTLFIGSLGFFEGSDGRAFLGHSARSGDVWSTLSLYSLHFVPS